MSEGKVNISVDLESLDSKSLEPIRSDVIDQLHVVFHYFNAGEPVTLVEGLCAEEVLPSGSKRTIIIPSPAIAGFATVTGQVVVLNPDGSVNPTGGIVDFANQLEKLQMTSALVSTDPVLSRILELRNQAKQNRQTELYNLFTIRDRLDKEIGKQQVLKQLGLNKTDWKKFREICNGKAFDQSRHQGSFDNTVPISSTDIAFARRFADAMIEGYKAYLANAKTAKFSNCGTW